MAVRLQMDSSFFNIFRELQFMADVCNKHSRTWHFIVESFDILFQVHEHSINDLLLRLSYFRHVLHCDWWSYHTGSMDNNSSCNSFIRSILEDFIHFRYGLAHLKCNWFDFRACSFFFAEYILNTFCESLKALISFFIFSSAVILSFSSSSGLF